jgi:hypothetical protein
MHPLLAVVIVVALLGAPGAVLAEPTVAAGYTIETVRKEGAIFSGLARDGDNILVTDLGSGGFYRLSPDRLFSPFGPTLPHGPDVIGDPAGPYSIIPHGDTYLVAQGWTPVDGTEGPHDHALLEIDEERVVRVIHRDFWNPFRFKVAGDRIYVVDAAQNSIERLTFDGAKTTVFSFKRLKQTPETMQNLSPTEFSGQSYEVDAVPTGIAIDGERLYASLFGGFPFAAGAGQIMSMSLDGKEPQVDVSGLNAPVDLAIDGNTILILEHGLFDQASGFQTGSGRLIAFDNMHGGRDVIADGLTRPVSFLLSETGEIVISELGGALYFLKRQATKP